MGIARAVVSRAFTERAPAGRISAVSYYRWLVIGTVCVGAFLGQLATSIAGLVLPTLEQVFHANVASVEWVAISYLLILAALVVPFGRLADMIGRKLLYTYGFLVFIAGSALCGFAPSLAWLVAFRVLQAVGAAMLQANSVAIIAAAARPRELGKAIGIQGAAQAVGLSVGPSVGGFLIAHFGWQWVFLIPVPFGMAGAAMGYVVLPQTQHASPAGATIGAKERFDWIGAVLFGPAIGAGLLALTYGSSWGWSSIRFLSTLALAFVLLAAFLLAELRAPYPLVDLALFKRRVFSAGIVAGLLSYAVLFGALFLIPFYMERILGQGPGATGLLLTPVPVALGVLAPIAGVITDRIGSRPPTVAGMAIATVALLLLAGAPLAPPMVILVALALLGIGLGLFTPPNNSAIMGSAPSHRLGIAGGILNMTRSLGTSLGVAATGAVLTLRLTAHAGHTVERTADVDPVVLLPAFRETLLFLAAIAAAAAVISALRGATRLAETTPQPETSAGTSAGAAEPTLTPAEATSA
jgi:EmrB/QacA subfamily drug resistance transporter